MAANPSQKEVASFYFGKQEPNAAGQVKCKVTGCTHPFIKPGNGNSNSPGALHRQPLMLEWRGRITQLRRAVIAVGSLRDQGWRSFKGERAKTERSVYSNV